MPLDSRVLEPSMHHKMRPCGGGDPDSGFKKNQNVIAFLEQVDLWKTVGSLLHGVIYCYKKTTQKPIIGNAEEPQEMWHTVWEGKGYGVYL